MHIDLQNFMRIEPKSILPRTYPAKNKVKLVKNHQLVQWDNTAHMKSFYKLSKIELQEQIQNANPQGKQPFNFYKLQPHNKPR